MRLMIDLLRESYSSNSEDGLFGSNSEKSLLCISVAIGQLEGRLMSASKVAQYVGIPRGTAIRKLAELTASGSVRRTAHKEFFIESLNDRNTRGVKHVVAMEKMIHQASTELSKMDSVKIAATTRHT